MDMLLASRDQITPDTQIIRVPASPFARHPLVEDQPPFASDAEAPLNGENQEASGLGDHSDPAIVSVSPLRVLLDQGHTTATSASGVAIIVALWRQRQDLGRAYQRLDLQCQAVVRRYSDGDKAVAAKRWAAIQKGEGDEVAPILTAYRLAMEPLQSAKHALELQLAKRARELPIWAWAKDVRGLGAASLAGVYGEAGRELSDYRSVSALWKRMGLAVIHGERQRRVTGEAALEHGYAPQRRAFCYVVSTSLMRAQKAADPYRELYDRRKAYELEREIPKAHAHNRALRVMVKELLKDAWLAERGTKTSPQT